MADLDEPAWRFSDASGSDSSSASTSSDHEADAAAAQPWVPLVLNPAPKPKGRPRKYPPGTTRNERRRIAKGLSARPVDDVVSTQLPVDDVLSTQLRPVGGELCELIANVVAAPITATEEQRAHVDKIVAEMLGRFEAGNPSNPLSQTLSTVSRRIDVPERTLNRRILTAGQAFFSGSRSMAASAFVKILALQRPGARSLVVEAVFTNLLRRDAAYSAGKRITGEF